MPGPLDLMPRIRVYQAVGPLCSSVIISPPSPSPCLCQAEIPLELLVNVDHPRDNEPWAWASYNTSGLVVPVFSNNVHEVRSYNRLAHMARGDILILVWVWGGARGGLGHSSS